jgi:UDP-N-acetylglucosamine diphosphorylase/glucosamine-1-phosphate N-acetyltransferase
MSTKRAAIILAAGKGNRMQSDLAKVLHQVHGIPIIEILVDRLSQFGFEKIVVVVGHQGEDVKMALADYNVEFVWQIEQLGTGHAVMMAEPALRDFQGTTLVALGDVPFLSQSTLKELFNSHEKTQAAATCLSAEFDDPTGYGRIIRKEKTDILMKIVEHKDATLSEMRIKEINSGTFCFDNQFLFKFLKKIGTGNAQGEYYLTDVIKLMYDNNLRVSTFKADNPDEVRGINSAEQLREMEAKFPDIVLTKNNDTK